MTSRFREKYPKPCAHLCPACARLCVLGLEHEGAHRCGLHEWLYLWGNRLTLCLFTNGLKPNDDATKLKA